MRRLVVAVAMMVLVACGSDRTPVGTSAGSSFAETTTTTSTTTTTTAAPTAYDQFVDFAAASRTMDGQLKAAAQKINGTGPPWTSVTADVAAAVTAADLTAVEETIPAGMPDGLRTATFVVMSDLASRWFAMSDFSRPYDIPEEWRADENQRLLEDLGHGAEAAARFSSDLAALESLAHATPSFAEAAPGSHAAAEVALLVQWIHMMEGGCGGTGGQIITSLPMIDWTPSTSEWGQHFDGTIDGIPFAATPAGDTWEIVILAC